MSEIICSSCGKVLGTTVTCPQCQEFVLESRAAGMSDEERRQAGRDIEAMMDDPPWYARFAPDLLWRRAKLLGHLVKDYYQGNYDQVPYATIVSIAAALAYVISPIDLIPDMLVPFGWTDDMLVVAMLFKLIGLDLKKYVKAKRLNPAEYGFTQDVHGSS